MIATIGAMVKYKTSRGTQKAPLKAACGSPTNGRRACGKCGEVFRNNIEAMGHPHDQGEQYWYCFEHGPEVLANPASEASRV